MAILFAFVGGCNEYPPMKQRLTQLTAALIVTIVTFGCSRNGESELRRIGKRFNFPTQSGFSSIQCHSWSYTVAMEGWQRTKITLLKAHLSPELRTELLTVFSNRTDVVEMPDSPVIDSTLTVEAPWWDPRLLKTYTYVGLDLGKRSNSRGRLEAFFGKEGDDVIYMIVYN